MKAAVLMAALTGNGLIWVVKINMQCTCNRLKNAIGRKGGSTDTGHIQRLGLENLLDDGICCAIKELRVIFIGDDGNIRNFLHLPP